MLLSLLLPAAAWAEEEQKKQPPPEFTSGYQPQGITTPLPRAEIFAYLDVAALLAALALAAYISLAKRSRSGLRALALFSLLYFGFYRQGCVCAVGSIQNVALTIGDSGYALPFVVGAFFLLPLLFALFFGRVFCAAVCPLGMIQDVVLLRPRKIPPPLEHALGLLPYLYLGAGVLFAATGSVFIICQYDPFVGFFRLNGHSGVISFGAALLLLGTFIGRPYCRFLCPYGVLLRWMAPFARWKVRITPSACIQCHLCADACPFGAIRPPSADAMAQASLSTMEDRSGSRRRLATLILLLPVLIGAGAWLGRLSSPALARMNRTVALAERVWAEEQGRVRGTTEASEAFRSHGLRSGELYWQAKEIRRRFDIGSTLFGAWAGLVVGLKLIALSIRRTQRDYEADPAACLSCARCYLSCPVEQERLGMAVGNLIPVSAIKRVGS